MIPPIIESWLRVKKKKLSMNQTKAITRLELIHQASSKKSELKRNNVSSLPRLIINASLPVTRGLLFIQETKVNTSFFESNKSPFFKMRQGGSLNSSLKLNRYVDIIVLSKCLVLSPAR